MTDVYSDTFNNIVFNDVSDDEICKGLSFIGNNEEMILKTLLERSFHRHLEKAKSDYSEVWDLLDDISKDKIANAYMDFEERGSRHRSVDDPIEILTKMVEVEFRTKLFIDFINAVKNERVYGRLNKTDQSVSIAIEKYSNNSESLILSLGPMLHLIKESSTDRRCNYADSLDRFLKKNKWNLNILYSNEIKHYITYPETYRTKSHHGYLKDEKMFLDCKSDTIGLMSWFLKSYPK